MDCPLLGTSNLWIGKMEHKTSAHIPCTFYGQLQEMIDDRKNRWSKRPGKYERSLYDLFQLLVEEWSRMVDNYLVIGSDYAGGMGEFGIRIEDLPKDDPPVYWHKDADSFSMWKLEHEKLSDFLLNVLIEALACVDYQSAEYELETKGWRYEEYFDLKKDDWVAGKSVLKRYGIDYLYDDINRICIFSPDCSGISYKMAHFNQCIFLNAYFAGHDGMCYANVFDLLER